MSWLERLKEGFRKTATLFSFTKVDLSQMEDVEDAFLQADVGYHTTSEWMNKIAQKKPQTPEQLRQIIYDMIVEKMTPVSQSLSIDTSKNPFVILMIGVNGAGKTTTIGKMGSFYKKQGLKVSFVAGDTFRAGATEQLQKWGERNNSRVYMAQTGADSAGLIYDSLKESRFNQDDVLFIDTAGRLHNRSDLMDELKKIVRVIKKIDETAPHAVLLVLDATVGQNALAQVQAFSEMIGVTGLVMTKIDGTAKGGILLALTDRFNLPIYALGVGEQIDDLQSFTAEQYAESLLGQ